MKSSDWDGMTQARRDMSPLKSLASAARPLELQSKALCRMINKRILAWKRAAIAAHLRAKICLALYMNHP